MFVNPSEIEGLPVVVLEAMQLWTPVVATKAGGVPGVVKNGETGMLVDTGDPQALSEAMFELLDQQERAQRIAVGARLMVEAEFGLETMVRTYEDIYREVLGG